MTANNLILQLKTYWKHLLAVFGIGIAVAFAANTTPTTINLPPVTITKDYIASGIAIPDAGTVSIKADIDDATYFDTSKTFTMTFQYSDDGKTWHDVVGCGWKGSLDPLVGLNNVVNPRPECDTKISKLGGFQGRLYITAPNPITLTPSITFQ